MPRTYSVELRVSEPKIVRGIYRAESPEEVVEKLTKELVALYGPKNFQILEIEEIEDVPDLFDNANDTPNNGTLN